MTPVLPSVPDKALVWLGSTRSDIRRFPAAANGRWEREDIEVVTPHYRGTHGASVARSGFSRYRGISLRISGRSGGGRGGGRHGALAEELWR